MLLSWNVLTARGMKQFRYIASIGRGQLVTLCTVVCATNNFVAPMPMLSRNIFIAFFICDEPVVCIYGANLSK